MARIARVVVPGLPHHITQRGNRRMKTFFSEADYRMYLASMDEWCLKHQVEIWAYCLMPNHVHLIATPTTAEGLGLAIGEAHRRYTRFINEQKGWKGHLWQGRFASYPLDEAHLLAAARYIELNPVRARLVKHPWDYPWSSCQAHLGKRKDVLVKPNPLTRLAAGWQELLASAPGEEEQERFRQHERTGRPLGDDHFLGLIEKCTGRQLQRKKPGPKKN